MKKIIITLLLLLSNILPAQVTQEWVATYNGVGVGSNVPKKSAVDKFGNIIVAGRSSDLQYYDDFITLKYNASGNLLWDKRYNGIGNNNDRIEDMLLDDSGNVYVTGESYEGPSGGTYNWVTIKYKPNGDTAWRRSFGWTGGGFDQPFSMIKDKQNNIYIIGLCRAYPPYNDDMVTIKYNSDGEFQWSKSYSSTQNGPDWGYAISVDDSNNIFSSGYGDIKDQNEIVTIKYNTNGDEIWIRKHQTLGGDYLRPIKSTIDKYNNVIVNGLYYLNDNYAFITIKYNPNGDLLWERIYKGDGNLNFCFALCTDDSANVYAAGRATSAVTGNDFVTIKYNQFGDTLWIRVKDGGFEQGDEVKDIIVDKLGNVYVTGSSDSTDGISNYLTIKYNAEGIIKWIKKYGMGDHIDIPFCINLDKSDNIIVSGFSTVGANNSVIHTIKYSELTNVFLNNSELFNNYQLRNYPNPFNPTTKIYFTLKKQEDVKVVVYNIEGKEITTITNMVFGAGDHNVKFNGNNLAAGTYFYSLIINNSVIDTKKMILIK